MAVFALFYCVAGAGICQMHGAPHTTFTTINECYESGQRVSGRSQQANNGRILMPDGSWYECRKKYLDNWHR
jgi:hypothetical protein